jgi:hypothetical protein
MKNVEYFTLQLGNRRLIQGFYARIKRLESQFKKIWIVLDAF